MEYMGNNEDGGFCNHRKNLKKFTDSEIINLIEDGSISGGFSIHQQYGIPRIKGGLEKQYNYDVLVLYEQLFTRRKYGNGELVVMYLNDGDYKNASDKRKWIWCQMAQIANNICYQDQKNQFNDFSSAMIDLFIEMGVITKKVSGLYGMTYDYTPVHDIFDDLQDVIKRQSYTDLFTYFCDNYETFSYSLRSKEVVLLIEGIERQFEEPYETIGLLNKLYNDINDDEYKIYVNNK